jgi:hypothetical protein
VGRGLGEDNADSKISTTNQEENQMEHAPIFKLDFICPTCKKHTTIYERSIEVVDDEVCSLELGSWEPGEDDEILEVYDVEAETIRVDSYGYNDEINWYCRHCDWNIPVDSREELFEWLHNHKMLIPK